MWRPAASDASSRRASVFARVHIGGIPVPPVVSGVGLLVWVVALGCLVQKLGQSRDVHC